MNGRRRTTELKLIFDGETVDRKLDQIISLLKALKAEEDLMAGELAKVQQDVTDEATVEQSAITLLQGLKAALDAAIASGNPAALTALSTQIETNTAALAAAVVANTPAAAPAAPAGP